jgi:hypothetical protein
LCHAQCGILFPCLKVLKRWMKRQIPLLIVHTRKGLQDTTSMLRLASDETR